MTGTSGSAITVECHSFVSSDQSGVIHQNGAEHLKEDKSTIGSSCSDVELRMAVPPKSMFQSNIGTVVSCMGSAVGTGNIWRFPRILATQSYSKGALTFYIAWLILLCCWSIPIILAEYAIGRFTLNSVPVAFFKFFGGKFIWVGGWLVGTIFFLSAYYPVIIGWCLYYFYVSCTASELPNNEELGLELFNNFVRDTYWPVLTQVLAVFLTGVFLFGGIRLIEKANLVLVPLLLAILGFTFGWSLTRPYADVGIAFLFTPTWVSLTYPSLWIAAAGQNAFDTGAGMSILMGYATFMGRSSGIVRYSFLIPIINNLVSFYASIMLFSTVFSTLIISNPTMTRAAILKIIQTTGPGSTGLTFTWIPVLFSRVGIFGRILCALFFLCLTFAGISSLLSEIQVYILTLKDFGVPHRIAVTTALFACALAGLPSAMNLEFLENQDNTWGYALIISGFLLALVVIIYGPMRFRRVLINDFGTDDWKAPLIWIPMITVLVPVEAIVLLGWWIYDYIRLDSLWYIITLQSVTSSLLEWFILIVFLIAVNGFAIWYRKDLFIKAKTIGCDPHDPRTYENPAEFHMEGIRLNTNHTNSGGSTRRTGST